MHASQRGIIVFIICIIRMSHYARH